jgi:2',3'-cyclic-nucleotide 2'-phosphodiesterase (5'-nucleotidase family)
LLAFVLQAPIAAAADGEVRIVYHADLDGRLAVPACGSDRAPGADYAATIGAIGRARAAADLAGITPPIVLLGGNFAGPDPFAASLLGRGAEGAAALADLLARARYDTIALGHQELGLPSAELEALLASLRARGATVVATNLRCEAARRAVCEATQRDVIVRRGDVAVGVLATIAPSVLPGIAAPARAGLALDDPVAALVGGVTRLRARGTTHLVVMVQGTRGADALAAVDALAKALASQAAADVLLAGGTAEDGGPPLGLLLRPGVAPVVGAPAGGPDLIDVRLPGGGAQPVVTIAAADAGDVDAETVAQLQSASAPFCQRHGAPIATLAAGVTLTRATLLEYALAVMRRRASAEIALVNRAFVKGQASSLPGVITRADLHRALPHASTIGAARLPGPVVEKLLGGLLDDRRVAILGLARKAGKLEVNGRPLDKTRSYRVATIAFVAAGGDGLIPPGAIDWRPLDDKPDVRDELEHFLRTSTAARDGNASVDPRTDFGPPPGGRYLLVGITDLGFDLLDTSIANAPGYGDPQLTRTRQSALKGELVGLLTLRLPRHDLDGRLDLKYGWLRSRPPGAPPTSGETADLAALSATYNYKGLRAGSPGRLLPDPFLRLRLESELTRPPIGPTQPRAYHHLELTATAGALMTIAVKLKLRAGGGVRRELVADGAAGRWRPLLEAGATLDPVALATVGALVVRFEGLADYAFIDPGRTREHQLRGTARLSLPLLPLVALTAGLDVFAVQRERLGWASAFDTTVGLRLHLDAAHQGL